jgi:DNA-directed RNA polymerase specialized sigma24 family protein
MPAILEQAQELQFLSDTQDISFSDQTVIDEPLFVEDFSAGDTYQSHEKQQSEADMRAAMSDTIWRNLYPALHSLACYLVRTSPLPYWRGQEDDLADDIAQETVRRVIERAQKAERGEAAPIQSLKQMANTVAYNYYRDLKRHDYRLSHLDAAEGNTHGTRFYPVDMRSDEYLLELVADKVDQDHLFDMLADEISRFPAKQRQAILVDLANRMYFDEEPTSLQESFLEVGIELSHYRQPLPENQRERGRHISLCSQAYKRIAHLPYTKE